ncbi:hypothetical protein ACIGFK_33940 [Streptomyces sp. NPDC085524]|uniref:hypothetical protein n=1 Tax=Streptomyces sp. NPDC085524 TaxID=3365728 RepID=UPI0037CF9031
MPSLEWIGYVPTAVSAVHALVAVVNLCRRGTAGRPGTSREAIVEPVVPKQCGGAPLEVAVVRVELAVGTEIVVRIEVAGVADAPAAIGAGTGSGPAAGGEPGPW